MRIRMLVRLLILANVIFIGNLAAQTYWLQTNGPYQGGGVQALAIDSAGTIFAGTSEGGVFRSTDEGNSWQQVNNDLPNDIRCLAVGDSNKLYAGSYGFGVFRSTDSGDSWTKINNGLTTTFIAQLAVNSDGHLFTTISQSGAQFVSAYALFRSTDSGGNWTLLYQPEYPYWLSCLTLGASGEIFLGGGYGVIIRSFDDGATWTTKAIVDSVANVFSDLVLGIVIRHNGQLDALCRDRYFQSPDSGATWKYVNDVYAPNLHSLVGTFDGSLLAVGEHGVYFLPDSIGWRDRSSGVGNYRVTSIVEDSSGMFYVGTQLGGVFKNNGLITSVTQQPSSVQPTSFVLAQNYPNPFNPTTTFQFSLPRRSFVTLTISDILGNQVANLAAEELDAGTYTIQWNASGLSSGMYFYRLTAGEFTETRKLILLK